MRWATSAGACPPPGEEHSSFHDGGDRLTDPLGRLLDFPVPEMGVAQSSAHVGMAEQTGDDRNRHAVHHRVTGMGMAKIVKANVLDARLAPGTVPGSRTLLPLPLAPRSGRTVPGMQIGSAAGRGIEMDAGADLGGTESSKARGERRQRGLRWLGCVVFYAAGASWDSWSVYPLVLGNSPLRRATIRCRRAS